MIRPLRASHLVFAFSIAWVSASSSSAVGMRVSPGGAVIQGLRPGERHELTTPLTVINDDDAPTVVTITALKPSSQGMKPPPGYCDIPDPSWLTFSESTVTVPRRGQAAVRMGLAIPAGQPHFNQHWSVAVAIRGRPVKGQMLSLALYPRFEIETEPLAIESSLWRRPKPPLGDLAATPSVVTADGVVPGAKAQRIVLRVWNNTDKPWQGQVTLIADAAAAKKERLDLSGGWNWLEDPSWVRFENEKLTLQPRSSHKLTVEVAVPEKRENYKRAREAILIFKSADGPAAFARVRVKTVAPKADAAAR